MNKMKDSGIEWIGEIPERWEIIKTKRKFSYTKQIVKERVEEYDRLSLTLNGVIKRDKEDAKGLQPDNFESYQILDKNQLVFKLIDLENVKTSRVGLSPYLGIVSPVYIILKNQQTNNKFYYYYFMNLYYQEIFNYLGGEGVRSAINSKDLLNIDIPFLKETEQEKISNYLDERCQKLDRIVKLEKELIIKLKEYKQSLITETVTKGLNPDAKMKDSAIEWIGDIPEHWEINKYKYLLKEEKNAIRVGPFGSELKGCDFITTGYKVFNQRSVLDKDFINGDCFINEKKYKELKAFKVNSLDILITTRGTIGKIAIAPEDVKDGIIHPCIIKSTINYKKITSSFLEYIFNKTRITLEQFFLSSNATTIAVIYSEHLRKVKLPLPPLPEQQQISNYLDKKCGELDKTIAQKEENILKLEEYKKSLIYECVTGKKEII